jgi:hypothetical protein
MPVIGQFHNLHINQIGDRMSIVHPDWAAASRFTHRTGEGRQVNA